jgi:hypothetical protein
MLYNRTLPKLLAVAAFSCAAIVLSSAAGADEQQEFRCPKPGTVIEYTEGGGKISFTSQDGMWCVGTGTGGQSWRRYALLAGPGSKFIENHIERIWPLQIGKEISFTFQGTSNNTTSSIVGDVPWYTETIRVLRKESLAVKAGVFESWVIEDRQDGRGASKVGFTGIGTYWYAPDLGYAVKYTYHVSSGIGTDKEFEAKAISSTAPVVATPAPAQPPPPTTAAPAKPPTAGSSSTPPTSTTTAQRLQELKDLLDRKLITPSEYEAKRKAILDAL